MSTSRRSIAAPGQAGSSTDSLLEYEEGINQEDPANAKLLTWMKAVTEELRLLYAEVTDVQDRQGTQQTCTERISTALDSLKIDVNDKVDTMADSLKATMDTEESMQASIKSLNNAINELKRENANLTACLKDLEENNQENLDILASTKRNLTADIDQVALEHQSKIASLEQKLRSSVRSGDTSTLNNTSRNIKFKIPTFTGNEKEKPVKFLRDLEKYINATSPDFDQFIYILSSALTEDAKEWWCLIETDIKDFTDFERKFKDYYWNSHIQRNLKKKIEFGRFNPKYDKSRANYAIHWLGIAKELDTSCDEAYLIEKIADHFEPITRHMINSMPRKDTTNLLKLLTDLDREQKSDNRWNTQDSKSSWQTNSITQESTSKKKSPKPRRKSIDNGDIHKNEIHIANLAVEDPSMIFSGNDQ